MNKDITIRCRNTGRSHRVAVGSTLEEVYRLLGIDMPLGPTSAKVNNKVEGLHFTLFTDKDVEYLDISSPSGMRTYTRSLFFMLYKAVRDLYPGAPLRIDTPVSNGYYCRLGADLTFSGHAHGGIWRLPFTDGLVDTNLHLLPSFTSGFYHCTDEDCEGAEVFVSLSLIHISEPTRP